MTEVMRKYFGKYQLVPIEFAFQAGDTAAGLADRGTDHSDVVLLATMPFDGFVVAMTADAIVGTPADVVLLVQVAGSAVAASSFTLAASLTNSKVYAPNVVPFAAGETLAVEVDSLTTMRDMVVVLWCAIELGD